MYVCMAVMIMRLVPGWDHNSRSGFPTPRTVLMTVNILAVNHISWSCRVALRLGWPGLAWSGLVRLQISDSPGLTYSIVLHAIARVIGR